MVVVAHGTFYATMAQVIPLVFILLMVDLQVLKRAQSDSERYEQGIGLMALVVAEFFALGAVYSAHDSGFIFVVVVLGAILGSLDVLMAAFTPVALAWTESLKRLPGFGQRSDRARLRFVVYGFVLMLAVVVRVLFG